MARLPWRELALALASFACVLGVLEVAARSVGLHVGTQWINRRTVERSPDPELLFRLRPGSVAQAEVAYRVNAHGMRHPPVAVAKPAGTRRVAVVGDSITFGYWVDAHDAFPAQLEALLSRGAPPHRPIEVLNFGVPGYNLAQDLAWLEKGALRFAPDAVVLGFCLNDLEDVFSYEYGLVVERERRSPSAWRRPFEIARGWLLDHSLLASWVDYRLTEAQVRRRYVERRARGGGTRASERRERARGALDAAFARMAATLAEAGGLPGLVAVFPTFEHPFDAYPHRWLHEAVAAAAERHGLVAVDLLPCFSAYPLEAVRVDPIHPSPLGHRVAAHALRDALAQEGALSVAAPADAPGDCRSYAPADFPAVRGY